MVKLAKDLRKFLRENGANHQIVWLLNSEDDQYYTIDDVRIDPEGDIVFDISFSNV